MAALLLEFVSLPDQIADHPVDLFDHCLRQYFGLNSNFNRRNRPARNRKAYICNWLCHRNSFPERSVASPPSNADSKILRVQNAAESVDTIV
jgi:hypothetical protein